MQQVIKDSELLAGTGDPLGRVETEFFRLGEPFELDSGAVLSDLELAYELYGELNADKSNAVLVFHALTGSQHAAGDNSAVAGVGSLWTEECHAGWWNQFIGPGRPLDTDELAVLCVNYVGGCYGSTGPTSVDPVTTKPYGASFPRVSFHDTVRAQLRLLDRLGIDRLHAVVGASTGGMACLTFSTHYPERVKNVILIATGMSVTPLQRILNFEQIRAIEFDREFAAGHYTADSGPLRGMTLARTISHKTFVSLNALEQRSRSEIIDRADGLSWYELTDPIESYMMHQGEKFARRFDANSYLRILDAWNRFDLLKSGGAESFPELFGRCRRQRYLLFTIDSDVCFYPEEQEEIERALGQARVPRMRVTVHSGKGHDSFLLEPHLYGPHLRFLLGLG